ncbi:MAG: SRPBCC domain-containing protein [Dehalococcoidia bacterium]
MRFEHEIVVPAGLDEVTTFLEDVPSVAQCIPDVSDVTLVGPDTYEGSLRMRLGPVGFTLGGTAVLDRSDPEVWRLRGEGRDRRVGAGVDAALEARLASEGEASTRIDMVADLQFSGRLAELGQPLIRRKADAMVRDFAANLRRVFETGQGAGDLDG